MTLRAVEGWDGYAAGLTGSAFQNIFTDKWSLPTTMSQSTIYEVDDRYTDERTWRITTSNNLWGIELDDVPQELAAGLYIYNRLKAYERSEGLWTKVFGFVSDSHEHIWIEISGRDLRIRILDSITDATFYNVIEPLRWNLIELKGKVHDTTGYWYVYVNGVLIGSNTGIDTKSTDTLERIEIWNQTDYTTIGDFYVCDLTGSYNNDVLGAFHIQGILPNANGDDSDWTPTAGDNYTTVNEATANEDTYVESGIANEQDLYNYENLSGSWDTIFGLQINSRIFLDGAGSETIAVLCSSNSTEDSANFTVSNVSMGDEDEYQCMRILEEDPDTVNTWSANGIDVAQFGVKFI